MLSLHTLESGGFPHNICDFIGSIGRMFAGEYKDAKEIWLLFDAADSGLSIDNVLELKEVFDLILSDEKEKKIYIIISANEYELASGERCIDVVSGKEVSFQNYEEYKTCILKSRVKKDERIAKAAEKERKKISGK